MAGVRTGLSFLAILAVVGLWVAVNRQLRWPMHPVFALVWAASFMHLGVLLLRRDRYDPVVLWTDILIVATGAVYVVVRYFQGSNQ